MNLTICLLQQEKINGILRSNWLALADDEKQTWRHWASWDKKRFSRDMEIYEKAKQSSNGKSNGEKSEHSFDQEAIKEVHVPKKKTSPLLQVPKKRKLT